MQLLFILFLAHSKRHSRHKLGDRVKSIPVFLGLQMDFWDDPFHMIAFDAFITEARAAQSWPDSEKVRQRAYREFERGKQAKEASAASLPTQDS